MNTDILVNQVVASLANTLREEHILRETLRSLVRLAKAEQSLAERRSIREADAAGCVTDSTDAVHQTELAGPDSVWPHVIKPDCWQR